MRILLVNLSNVAFGVGVITPQWLYVLAGATPPQYDDPVIVDETLEPLDAELIRAGDVVGIGIHTANALRGFEVGRLARERGAFVNSVGSIRAPTRTKLTCMVARTQSCKGTVTLSGQIASADDIALCQPPDSPPC